MSCIINIYVSVAFKVNVLTYGCFPNITSNTSTFCLFFFMTTTLLTQLKKTNHYSTTKPPINFVWLKIYTFNFIDQGKNFLYKKCFVEQLTTLIQRLISLRKGSQLERDGKENWQTKAGEPIDFLCFDATHLLTCNYPETHMSITCQ